MNSDSIDIYVTTIISIHSYSLAARLKELEHSYILLSFSYQKKPSVISNTAYCPVVNSAFSFTLMILSSFCLLRTVCGFLNNTWDKWSDTKSSKISNSQSISQTGWTLNAIVEKLMEIDLLSQCSEAYQGNWFMPIQVCRVCMAYTRIRSRVPPAVFVSLHCNIWQHVTMCLSHGTLQMVTTTPDLSTDEHWSERSNHIGWPNFLIVLFI